jgi:hypothetical protein
MIIRLFLSPPNKKPTLSSGLALLKPINYSNATLATWGKAPESKSRKTGVGERHRKPIILGKEGGSQENFAWYGDSRLLITDLGSTIFCLFSSTSPILRGCYLTTSCYGWIEKGVFTPKAPRWKVDGRQSSSVSVLLPTGGLTAPSVSEGKFGFREAGIDSVAEFRGLM